VALLLCVNKLMQSVCKVGVSSKQRLQTNVNKICSCASHFSFHNPPTFEASEVLNI